jgi:uncharacterized DUF497 family protein
MHIIHIFVAWSSSGTGPNENNISDPTEWTSPKPKNRLKTRHAFFQFDGRHSLAEERFFLLGKTRTGQLLMTVFTWRGVKIRIISSRRASRLEATGYEERIRLQ